jgi:hypothetical protein
MGAPALGRIHNQGGMHPQAVANQVVMHRSNGQQRRNIAGFGTQTCGVALGIGAIAQHQNCLTGFNGFIGPFAQCLDSLGQPSGPSVMEYSVDRVAVSNPD